MEGLSLFSEIEVEFVGAAQLQQYYRRATDAATASFQFKNRITLPSISNVSEAYIGYISTDELLRIITINPDEHHSSQRINRKLFFDNVRDFDPESEINNQMADSLISQSEAFVYRNNGITVVARQGRPTGDNFRIEDYQVVNGCQTSNVVFNERLRLSGSFVPFRLVVSDDVSFVRSIIVGTNKQNPVRDEQFWALRPFLKDFEEYVRNQPEPRNLYFERRENQYRFEEVPERVRIIDAVALLKAVVSMFLGMPHRAGRDFRQIKREFDKTLFLDDHNVKPYHAAAYVYYRLEFLFRTKRISPEWKRYRIYIMWFIARRGANLTTDISVDDQNISIISDRILNYADDEAALVSDISRFVFQLEGDLGKAGLKTDRDALRNDDILAVAKSAAQTITSTIFSGQN
ncbi:AIPR family protein [Rhizobium grahamii]|uniref:AIPR family protein n=1 Tax=Rhizobium grahamii TaxID=1120045 RepID=A0A5Q0C8S2_9HYPH|nr:AIPR family protein [Rhizobium grahamii]